MINIIESLYANSNCVIIPNNMTGDFFHTTVGVRQGYLISPILFNIFRNKLCKIHFKTTNQLYLLVVEKSATLVSPTIYISLQEATLNYNKLQIDLSKLPKNMG